MTDSGAQAALAQALQRLVDLAVIPAAARALEESTAALRMALRQVVTAEIPAFSASGNPEVLPSLDKHAQEHIEEILRLLGGLGDFAFVRLHAQRRAEQRFPLEASLHAYHCGHRVFSRWMREGVGHTACSREETLAALSDFAIEYTDTCSTLLTSAYVAHVRIAAEAELDQRTELLNILLSGYDESDGRVARLLKGAGYLSQRQSFCVVLAQSTDAAEMENPARAQRISEAIAKAVESLPARTLIGIRHGTVTAVFTDIRRLSGWTAPQTNLAERIRPLLEVLGPAVLIGMSSDQPSTAFVPKAMREARVALDCASVADRVIQFSSLPVRRLLLHSGRDRLSLALPSWLGASTDADERARGVLVQTLRALADANMNVQEAARLLSVHANTIYSRARGSRISPP